MPITTNGEHMVIAMLVTTSFMITTPTMKYMQRFSVKNFLREIVNGSTAVCQYRLLQNDKHNATEVWWGWLGKYHLLDG